jgi:hypothetical protein
MIGYERVAANSMPVATHTTTTIPLGLDIEKTGDYTIAMPEGISTVGITLLDVETGVRILLSAGMDYTVTLPKGKCEDRLYLEISPIRNTPTDCDQITDGVDTNRVQKYLIDGRLYLKKDGILYDAQGHRL